MISEDRRAHVKELQQELNRLFLRRRQNAIQMAKAMDSRIEPASYSILATLQRAGAQRMTDISKRLGVGKPTLSRQLSALAERGFITKKADPADGRALVISLTEEGKSRLEAAQGERSERYLHMLETWDEEEICTLCGLLAKMNQTYTEYDDAAALPPRTAASQPPKVA